MKKLRLWTVTLLLLPFLFLPLGTASDLPFANVPFDVNNIPEPAAPPAAVRDFFELSPFYQQWINVGGFPVIASARVNPYAVKEAAWVIWQMIGHRKSILKNLGRHGDQLSVLAIDESWGDLPEYEADDSPLKFVGAHHRDTVFSGVTTASEENLLDPILNYSFLIHEFTHVIHNGLRQFGSEFDNRLNTFYNAAMKKGLWSGTYASSNRDEYLAEAVGSWFNAPYQNNPIKTREQLKRYDPDLAKLIGELLGDFDWRYTSPRIRADLAHLRGYDFQQNLRSGGPFAWEIRARELEKQLKDPNSDGGGKWVNLKLYPPSDLATLLESTERGESAQFIWVNLTGNEISFYYVDSDGVEHWHYTAATKWWFDIGTYAGAIWLIKDHNGNPLAVFRAEEKVGRVLVAPVLNLITPGLSKSSGDNQTGISGAALPYPFVVEVRDENLSVLKGISVTFTVTAGGGTLNTTHTTTDENGRAESILTLGPNRGTNTVSVSAAGIERTVTFNAVAEALVDIPDPNLRATVENDLGKAKDDLITPSEMATLTDLVAKNANISDLTGLEFATNLTFLWLENNNITDISSVTGLTKLTRLDFGNNFIADISPVAGLDNLTSLWLWDNSISDISSVTGLTNLTKLGLWGNSISDISPLVANIGLGSGDTVYVQNNPLSYQSIHTHIPALQSRGVTVEFDNRAYPALLKIAGDNQHGASFVSLSQPFIVEAQDASGSALTGISVTFTVTAGGGTLSTQSTMTDANGRAQSTLILGPNLGTNTVEVSAAGIESTATFYAIADTELPPMTADVNSDGNVNILDLILIASSFGGSGQDNTDVNRDGVVNVLDLVLVAGMFEGAAAAPSAHAQIPETLTAIEVQGWLTDARSLEVRDSIMKRGFVVLEQLLASLTPKETELLANYPNPFNPETWIPYRLAEDAFVTLLIYDLSGQVIRTLEVGHRIAAAYESRSKAIHWNGRNDVGEQVASGIYFYTLTVRSETRAGDFSATRRMVILK